MSGSKTKEWDVLLSRLNSLLLNKDRWRSNITPEMQAAGWCGSSPASEELISNAESRLGIRLPPSYRGFLSVANGWYIFSSFIERLLPVCEIDWLPLADPDSLAAIQQHYQEHEISDE